MIKYAVMFAVLCGSLVCTTPSQACEGRLLKAAVRAPLVAGRIVIKGTAKAVRGAARGLKGAAKVVSYPVRFRVQNRALFPRAKSVVKGTSVASKASCQCGCEGKCGGQCGCPNCTCK